jgi:molybdopterin-containing oxidoreductase family iron-sulfur binding subunit
VWDNELSVSPKTAKEKFGIEMRSLLAIPELTAKVVKVTVNGASLEVPVWIAPGHADDSMTLELGYGRVSSTEKVANGESINDSKTVGVDAYALRTSTAPWFMPVSVEMTDRRQQLSCTQEHWDMHDRKIALEANLDRLEDVSHELEELRAPTAKLTTDQAKKQVTLQAPVDYSKMEYKWGMAVDLNRCSGCSACLTACQSENNIPVVGRDGVKRNREMFWLRLDRYFSSDLENPTVITQMVTCQQCETAPCEYVCPVNATVHSDEGLNDMIYNRCIGTRYCSNNCPYKVRRFNYFNYTGEYTSVQKLAQNPDVTVRARGVMEKCTFCIQRIEGARITSRRVDHHLEDGEVKTACQQACPTSAIEFGNLNDPQSRVSKAHADGRAYNLLQQLGTRPRNRYLTRIRNPNPKLVVAKTSEHQEAAE